MKRFSFIVILLFLLSGFSTAYQISIDTSRLIIQPSSVQGLRDFSIVYLNNKNTCGLPVTPGEPALPGYIVQVALPPGMDIDSVDISYAEPEIIPGYYKIAPQQKPISENEQFELVPPNEEIYSSSKPFPGKIAYSWGSGNASGYQLGSILFAPVQYNSLIGQLIFYREILFSLTLTGTKNQITYPKYRIKWIDDNICAGISKNVINPDEIVPPTTEIITSYNSKGLEDIHPYLIITDEASESYLSMLFDWKKKKGLNPYLITTEDIESIYTGTDLQEKVRNCIIDYYKNYATQFVLLISGNGSNLGGNQYENPPLKLLYPCGHYYEYPSDNYYGCLDGTWDRDNDGYFGESHDQVDLYYDVYVGRIQCATPSTLPTITDKILCYEGTSSAAEVNPYDYENRALLTGAWMDEGTTNGMDLMEDIEDLYLTSTFWNPITELWDSTYPGGGVFYPDSFLEALNTGQGIVANLSHGGHSWIGTNPYDANHHQSFNSIDMDDLLALTNAPNYTAFFYTAACQTTQPEFSNNCPRSFLAAPNGGGVGFIGNTREGLILGYPWEYGSYLLKEYFNQFTQNDIFINGETFAFHKNALASLIEAGNDGYRKLSYELLLCGDPDIWAINDTVGSMAVTHDRQIPIGQQNYSVHVDSSTGGSNFKGALVCLWKGHQVYDAGVTDENGDITFSINPTSTGYIFLTICAHNHETFEAYILVTESKARISLEQFNGKHTNKGNFLAWKVNSNCTIDGFNLYRRNKALNLGESNKNIAIASSATKKIKSKKNISLQTNLTSDSSKWVRVNVSLIKGKNPYSFLDRTGENITYDYQLEVVVGSNSQFLNKADGSCSTTSVDAIQTFSFDLTIKPNPVKANAQLVISLTEPSAVAISIYDLSGRKVLSIASQALSAGENLVDFPTKGLSNGVYIVQMQCEEGTIQKNLLIAH